MNKKNLLYTLCVIAHTMWATPTRYEVTSAEELHKLTDQLDQQAITQRKAIEAEITLVTAPEDLINSELAVRYLAAIHDEKAVFSCPTERLVFWQHYTTRCDKNETTLSFTVVPVPQEEPACAYSSNSEQEDTDEETPVTGHKKTVRKRKKRTKKPASAAAASISKEEKREQDEAAARQALIMQQREQQKKLLLSACKSGNSRIVQECLKKNGDPNTKDEFGIPALSIAVVNKHTEIVKALLRAGASPEMFSTDWKTPLEYATPDTPETILEALVIHGANRFVSAHVPFCSRIACTKLARHPRARCAACGLVYCCQSCVDVEQSTHKALCAAINLWNALRCNDTATIEKLANQAGSNLGTLATLELPFQESIIHQAALKKNDQFVMRCLAAGARPSKPGRLGVTVLHLVAAYCSADTLRTLLGTGVAVDPRTLCNESPLHFAAYNKEHGAEMIPLLLAAGVPHDTQETSDGCTALHYAVAGGDQTAVRALLTGGAAREARNKHGKTALDMAQEKKNAFMISALLDRPIIVIRRPQPSPIPTPEIFDDFVAAISENNIEHLQALIAQEPDLSKKPFHMLLEKTSPTTTPEIIDLLLKNGANRFLAPRLRVCSRRECYVLNARQDCIVCGTPYCSRECNRQDWPMHKCYCIAQALFRALAFKQENVIVTYMVKPANIERAAQATLPNGQTVLHQAIFNNHELMIVSLLRYKASVQAVDDLGQSPLQLAAHNCREHILKCLLKNGANPNHQNDNNEVPLHYATLGKNADANTKILLGANADPNRASTRGAETPLHCAARLGKIGAMASLIAHGADQTCHNSRGLTPRDCAAVFDKETLYDTAVRQARQHSRT